MKILLLPLLIATSTLHAHRPAAKSDIAFFASKKAEAGMMCKASRTDARRILASAFPTVTPEVPIRRNTDKAAGCYEACPDQSGSVVQRYLYLAPGDYLPIQGRTVPENFTLKQGHCLFISCGRGISLDDKGNLLGFKESIAAVVAEQGDTVGLAALTLYGIIAGPEGLTLEATAHLTIPSVIVSAEDHTPLAEFDRKRAIGTPRTFFAEDYSLDDLLAKLR